MMEFLNYHIVPFTVVLTKADKLSRMRARMRTCPNFFAAPRPNILCQKYYAIEYSLTDRKIFDARYTVYVLLLYIISACCQDIFTDFLPQRRTFLRFLEIFRRFAQKEVSKKGYLHVQ